MEIKSNKNKIIIILAVIGLLIFLFAVDKNKIIAGKFIGVFDFIKLPVSKYSCDTEKIKEIQETIQNEKNKILLEENKKLKATLNFLSKNNYLDQDKNFFLTTYVVGKDPIDPSLFIINKGLNNGLKKGMPVIKDNGILIGKLINVKDNFSHFMLITDNRSEISGAIQDEEEKISGIIKGGYNLAITMELIPIDKNIDKNDIVITSGTEECIPRGLIIGKISNIEKNDNDIFQKAKITPLSPSGDSNIVTVFIGC